MLCSLPLTSNPISAERGPYITTYSGKRFYIDECNVQDIPLMDIAHALSMNCRFNGHLDSFYSVAEHSVLISKLAEAEEGTEAGLWGLLHDISEAFVPDIPRPFKGCISGFKEFEDKVLRKAAEHFALEGDSEPAIVKWYDHHIVRDEAAKFMVSLPDWIDSYESVCPTDWLRALPPYEAKWAFLERFNNLMNCRKLGL